MVLGHQHQWAGVMSGTWEEPDYLGDRMGACCMDVFPDAARQCFGARSPQSECSRIAHLKSKCQATWIHHGRQDGDPSLISGLGSIAKVRPGIITEVRPGSIAEVRTSPLEMH